MKTNRRTFVIHSSIGAAGLVIAGLTQAQPAMLLESSSQAKSVGYRDDSSKVISASYPKHADGQKCAGCQMFRASQAGMTAGACAIFPGKLVATEGWCDAFVQKA
jgi:High potential iron-sulfur protein